MVEEARMMRMVKKLFPHNRFDAVAMAFTFTMIPIAYVHGLYNILPTVYPVSGVSEEEAAANRSSYIQHAIFMTFLFVNAVGHLCFTLLTNTSSRRNVLPVTHISGWVFCQMCNHNSPPRSWHCPLCKTCILRRDHHCYFTGLCIGYHNHRFFITFLAYVVIAAAYATVMSAWVVSTVVGGLTWRLIPSLMFPVLAWMIGYLQVPFVTTFLTSMAFMVLLGSSALLGLQLMQIWNGQTYYEYCAGTNEYCKDLHSNIVEVMGRNWWFSWLCPLFPSPQPGDGTQYTASGEDETPQDGQTGVLNARRRRHN